MINKNPACLSLAAALLVMGDGAWADDDPEQELSPVLVEGRRATRSRFDEPPHSRFALPASVEASQTLSREDIEAIRPRDVYDLVEASLGMTISRQGARVHNFSYSRGDSVNIILDGVYLTQTEAQRVLGDLPPELIESVQFLRDSSVITIGPLMGFGAANSGSPNQGYIVINTRKGGPGKDGSELRAGYASYDTWKASGFHGHSWADGRASMGIGYQHSQSGGKPDWNNAYRGDSLLLNGGYQDRDFSAAASAYVNRAARDIQRAVGTYTGATAYPASGPTPAGVLDKNIWRYDPMDTALFSANLARMWDARNTTAFTYGWTEARGTQYAYTTTVDKAWSRASLPATVALST
ncbi:MAG: TonB-dependent receptor plug domain-containing protein, partial [Zoogloea sp.]|nr:TonB-dependent receptor plug domain-containing protein [Zoogloea sp.]